MMLSTNIKMARASLKASRGRTFLTMLGIMIGVVSVITVVGLGEGVKKQVSQQINQRGSDLVTVLPGKRIATDDFDSFRDFSVFANPGVAFTDEDYKALAAVPEIEQIAPLSRVTGKVTAQGKTFDAKVVATSSDIPNLLNREIAYGEVFSAEGANQFAVIGINVAEELYGENVPVGKSFTIRGKEFKVLGIFEEFDQGAPFFGEDDYNSTIFIPHSAGVELLGGSLQIYQLFARPTNPAEINKAVSAMEAALLRAQGGQGEFTILKQEETLAIAGRVLDLITGLIAGIAAISLVVGGIGIMNIMLVSVSERTREIGVRKAVGGTNNQILGQFLVEAILLSALGGVFGVFLSLGVNFVIRISTDLQPVITLPIIGIASGVAFVVGVFFGITPALKAARKDPIEALRYE